MSLAAGTRLGPYEILAPLGAGGMGEVYRAKDTRLGREVAIKVLPAALSRDADRMRRFEKEVRAASALTHPNIVTIHDVMDGASGLCIVMELVSGRTLRETIAEGALAPKKWLDIASQAAEGLARAHASGIVHRDLKPENLMISDDGLVKILDFGLAKLTQPEEATGATQGPTASGGTEPGIVMGTVGYMSPEQARGKPLDFRSDQFSLGSIAYEMATGRRAFSRESTPETLSAIIREEPEPVGAAAPRTPPPARWIVERCLSKDPQQRYASTQDLARDLASVRDHLSELSVSGPVVPAPARRSRARVMGLAGALALAATAGVLGGRRMASSQPPSFTPLTYRRGWIQSARFAPDGQSVVYSAAWDGQPARLFLMRPDSPDEVAIPLPSADILSISKSGEMAIALDCRNTHQGVCSGALAKAPITGGATRPIADDAQQADWAPDGENLAVARDVGGRGRLEFPIGKVLYETTGHTSFPRLSPRADRIAFVDNPLKTDNRGSVAIMDLAGRKKTLTGEWPAIDSLAWSPSGDEIWFTGFRGDGSLSSALYAVSLTGRERLVARFPAGIRIHDVARSGRLLITQDTDRAGISGRAAGEPRERDLSWLNWSVVRDISRDGKTLLFDEEGGLRGPDYATCIRGTNGSPVVRLGYGTALALSPDAKWAVVQLNQAGFPLSLLATRTGEHRILPTGGVHADEVEWVDERRLVFVGSAPGRPTQLYVQDIGEGGPRAISTENVEGDSTNRIAPSPDGQVVAAVGPDHKCRLYPIAGGAARSIPGIAEGEFPQVWSADGRWLYFRGPQVSEPPVRLFRVEPETGRREVRNELIPSDPAGLVVIGQVAVAPDGESYAYSYGTSFSRLVVAEGIK
jgi:Tol biopolymer transport system component